MTVTGSPAALVYMPGACAAPMFKVAPIEILREPPTPSVPVADGEEVKLFTDIAALPGPLMTAVVGNVMAKV